MTQTAETTTMAVPGNDDLPEGLLWSTDQGRPTLFDDGLRVASYYAREDGRYAVTWFDPEDGHTERYVLIDEYAAREFCIELTFRNEDEDDDEDDEADDSSAPWWVQEVRPVVGAASFVALAFSFHEIVLGLGAVWEIGYDVFRTLMAHSDAVQQVTQGLGLQ